MTNTIIKPTYSIFTLNFNCPKCNSEYSFSSLDLKQNDYDWFCGCGESFKIPRIRRFKVKIQYWNRKKNHIHSKKQKTTFNINMIAAISILVGLGYSRKEVIPVCTKYKDLSKEDIIKKTILEINSNETDK